jgi:hypothetical protein
MLLAFISILCGDSLRMPRHEFLVKVNGESDELHPPIPAFGARDAEIPKAPVALPVPAPEPAPAAFSSSALRQASNKRN